MNVIIADTETNGKALNFKAPFTDLNNWPRITQLSWVVLDVNTGQFVSEQNHIVKPDGWTVPEEQFFIDNNISTQRCEEQGKPFQDVANIFVDDVQKFNVDVLICHNINFDYNVIAAELTRYQIFSQKKLTIKLCTMETTTDLLKLPGKYGYKFPSLQELHNYLFGTYFQGNHDAMADVEATARCFVELYQRGHYNSLLSHLV